MVKALIVRLYPNKVRKVSDKIKEDLTTKLNDLEQEFGLDMTISSNFRRTSKGKLVMVDYGFNNVVARLYIEGLPKPTSQTYVQLRDLRCK